MRLLLAAALLTLAVPLFAAPRKCSNGQTPKLSGDLFSPVECSTKTLTAPLLPGLPAVVGAPGAPSDLKDLEGRWEGVMIHALGRYELLLTVKTSRGKTEFTLETKEQQFRERLTDRLVLRPAKSRGAFEALLTTSLTPPRSV